jgi:hypothetical protein
MADIWQGKRRARGQDGKTERWQDGNCRLTVLPFSRFATLPLCPMIERSNIK